MEKSIIRRRQGEETPLFSFPVESLAPYTDTLYRTPVKRQKRHTCDRKQLVYLVFDPRIGLSKQTVSVFLSRSRAERFADLRNLYNECQMSIHAYSCSQCGSLNWWFRLWESVELSPATAI